MKTRTSEDVLAGAARLVCDADSLKWWVEELLSNILPNAAVLCGQSIPHSGGYAAIQTWSFGLPPGYQAAIVCVGNNVRSPILTRLIRSGDPEFFDSERDWGVDIDPSWRASFRRAGWYNVLGLSHMRIWRARGTGACSPRRPSTTWERRLSPNGKRCSSV
jgi:hypothetical protein